MFMDDEPHRTDTDPHSAAWPVVPPSQVGIVEWDWDPHYMGMDLRLEILNSSPYLVAEATLRIDGRGRSAQRIVASRVVQLGPLFPGVPVRREVGIGAPEGISGLSFETVAVRAVGLTPPQEMTEASEYPALQAEIVAVTEEDYLAGLPEAESGGHGGPPTAVETVIRIRVRNAGPATVERARLRLEYFAAPPVVRGEDSPAHREAVAEWILDMPHQGWNPQRPASGSGGCCPPADPLPPGGIHEFRLPHPDGGPSGWGGTVPTTAVTVLGVRLGSSGSL